MSDCQCNRGVICIVCFERCDDPSALRTQLTAAIAALAAERVAHAATRREWEADRAALIRHNAAANDEVRLKLRMFSEQRKLTAERDAAREALARLEGLARELVAVIQRGKPVWVDCAFDTDGMIVSVTIPHGAESALAAALPPTPAEPPAPARRPPPLVAAVGTNDLGNGEHSPSRVNVAAAEPPAPPRSVDVCACGRRTHWGHCEVCHGGTGGESPCPSSAEPPAPALLPVTGESLRTGELPDGSVTESAIERAAQAWPAMVPAPVAEAGSGVCDECNGEGWIAHPAGTKFGCLHCHMCGGSGKGDL
jgi:hypothetical protein